MLDLLPLRGRRSDVPEIFKELDDWFKHMMKGFHELPEEIGNDWNPKMDITETSEALIVKAELPGLESKDVDIALDRDILVIKGEKQQEKEETGKNYHWKERRFGSFRRAFRLPVEVKTTAIEATFTDGVLKVVLPKVEEAKKHITHVKIH